MDGVGGEHVSGLGDGGQVRACRDQLRGGVDVLDHRDVRQQAFQRDPGRLRAGCRRWFLCRDQRGRPACPGGETAVPAASGGTGTPGTGRRPGQQQRGAAGVGVLQQPDRYRRRSGAVHDDGVRGAAEGGCDRGLAAGLDGDHGRQGSQYTGHPGAKHVFRAVLAVEAKLEGVAAGGQCRPLPFTLTAGSFQCGNFGENGVQGLTGILIVGIEGFLAIFHAGDLGFEGVKFGLGEPPALLARALGIPQPAQLGLGRFDPGTRRADLPGEPGQPFTAVSRRAEQAGDTLVFRRGSLLGSLLGRRCPLQGAALVHDPAFQPGLLLADTRRLLLEPVRITPGVRDGVRCAEEPPAFFRKGAQGPEPFTAGCELVPGVPRRVKRRGGFGRMPFERGLLLAARGERLLHDLPARLQRGFVRHVPGQRRLQLDELIGEKPGAGITDLELDGLGPPGHGGLFAQRGQLPPDFAGEVAEPLQVRLHGFEFADRFFLAAAVLEDTCGLFDESAPFFRRGMQDLVQLPLADDHMHLFAQARVREQLLNVQQPASGTVDGVFRAAGSEQGARDGDFAVLDRQGAVAVVDGQGNVRPAQRRAARGAGEDDIFHLAAAQGLGSLFAHHPGECVHDVRLARAVGTHHGGDARFEVERRGGRERLEAADGQAFEVQSAEAFF